MNKEEPLKNWKTTAWGVVAILAALATALVQWHSGQHVDWISVLKSIATIATGAGLIHAADGSALNSVISKILPK